AGQRIYDEPDDRSEMDCEQPGKHQRSLEFTWPCGGLHQRHLSQLRLPAAFRPDQDAKCKLPSLGARDLHVRNWVIKNRSPDRATHLKAHRTLARPADCTHRANVLNAQPRTRAEVQWPRLPRTKPEPMSARQ